jgi:hypothetical protein
MTTYPIFRGRRIAIHTSLALLGAAFAHISAAQTDMAPATESAANPAAQVPPVSYRSVFRETSLGVEKDSADWRKANNEVGKFLRGHIDILKWEEQENAKAMKEPMAQPMTAPNSAVPDATKPAAAPAHHH